MAALMAAAALAPLPAAAAGFQTLYSFAGGADGLIPANFGRLLMWNGTLYGTTGLGGTANQGTLFAYRLATKTHTVLHHFNRSTDGAAYPVGALCRIGTTIYGATALGMDDIHIGTVYSYAGGLTVQKQLGQTPQASNPAAGLTCTAAAVFGTTQMGGAAGAGAVFKLVAGGAGYSLLHSFAGNDGQGSYGQILAYNGMLFGTTEQGGTAGFGTIFAMSPKIGAMLVLHSFANAEGALPTGTLAVLNGMIYGVLNGGNTGNAGAIFATNPATGATTIVHAFSTAGAEGANPMGGLVALGGKLYGTTTGGGPLGFGALYSFDPATGTVSVLHSFANGADGREARAPLLAQGAALYGTTALGGASGAGTIFKYVP